MTISYYQIPIQRKLSYEQIFCEVMQSRVLTFEQRQRIDNAIKNNSLTREENVIVKRLFYNLRRGFIKLVD